MIDMTHLLIHARLLMVAETLGNIATELADGQPVTESVAIEQEVDVLIEMAKEIEVLEILSEVGTRAS